MKKGFTLIEIIGVVVILGLVALLAFPPLLNLIKGTEEDIDSATEQILYSASSEYTTKYMDDFPKKENYTYCITIRNLVKEDMVASNIVDNLDTFIKITVKNQKYEYLILKGSETCTPSQP